VNMHHNILRPADRMETDSRWLSQVLLWMVKPTSTDTAINLTAFRS